MTASELGQSFEAHSAWLRNLSNYETLVDSRFLTLRRAISPSKAERSRSVLSWLAASFVEAVGGSGVLVHLLWCLRRCRLLPYFTAALGYLSGYGGIIMLMEGKFSFIRIDVEKSGYQNVHKSDIAPKSHVFAQSRLGNTPEVCAGC